MDFKRKLKRHLKKKLNLAEQRMKEYLSRSESNG